MDTIYSGTTAHIRSQSRTATGNTSGADLIAHDGTYRDIGFNTCPVETTNASTTLAAQHCGAVIYYNDGTAGRTVTTPSSSSTDFPVGGMTTIINHSDTTRAINQGSGVSLIWQDGTSGAATGNRTLARGVATLWRHSAGAFFIWGNGLS